MSDLKESAIDFLRLAASGQAREAFRKYAAANFRHHNACFKSGAESLMLAMEENAKQNPQKVLDIKRALQDGDLVATHSHVRQNPGDRGAAVVHIFRFEGERIASCGTAAIPCPTTRRTRTGCSEARASQLGRDMPPDRPS